MKTQLASPPAIAHLAAWLMAVVLVPAAAQAQVAPTAGQTPPDDEPSIKIGATIFADYTFQQKPTVRDADGNQARPSSFNVARSYLNVSGKISRLVAFRITPDVSRESGAGSSLSGSMTFRLKYAYAQLNLDDWLPKGTWVRFGIQPTPFLEAVEGIYRYRFQGTYFIEREGYMASADAGASVRAAFPGDYGEVHLGLYNGEGYSRAEANDQKSIQARVAVRLLPTHPLLRGWRVQGFYNADHVVRDAERTRAVLNTTFEHKHVNAGFDYLRTKDQVSAVRASIEGEGWSVWATPKLPKPADGSSWEALLRYDRMKPNTAAGGISRRTIAGASYWFPKQGSVSAALLLDVERVSYEDFAPGRPTEQRVFVHMLVAF